MNTVDLTIFSISSEVALSANAEIFESQSSSEVRGKDVFNSSARASTIVFQSNGRGCSRFAKGGSVFAENMKSMKQDATTSTGTHVIGYHED